MHGRLPTDDNLWASGCITVSVCSLCGATYETTIYLFLLCLFATSIWQWVQTSLSCSIDHTSFENLLGVCNRNWSNQVWDVVLALVINAVSVIWQCRNKRRFEDYGIPFPRAINIISSSVSLSGRFSKGAMSSSIDEFLILKCFLVGGHPPKAPMIKQVIWTPPLCKWVKCNTDGSAKGSPGWAACGGIFWDYRASFVGCSAVNLGISYSLHAELTGVMWAIDIAANKGWSNLWLECDSSLAVAAFQSGRGIPWKL